MRSVREEAHNQWFEIAQWFSVRLSASRTVMVTMNSPKRPNTIFHERKKYLLAELRVIDVAILNAKQSEDALDWIKRLQKWRADLEVLVENMPEP